MYLRLQSILSDDESSRDIEEGSTEDADVGEEHSTTSNSGRTNSFVCFKYMSNF